MKIFLERLRYILIQLFYDIYYDTPLLYASMLIYNAFSFWNIN